MTARILIKLTLALRYTQVKLEILSAQMKNSLFRKRTTLMHSLALVNLNIKTTTKIDVMFTKNKVEVINGYKMSSSPPLRGINKKFKK